MNLKEKDLKKIVKDSRVLFITTKNIDYIRNVQEIKVLNKNAKSIDVIFSKKKNYISRVFDVWYKSKRTVIQKNDVVFIGFAPQLIIPFIGYKFRDKPIIIDFFISVYDTLVCDRKKFKNGGICSKICHYLDEITIKRANYVITDTKTHAEFFISEFHADSSIFETMYLEADSSIYFPRPQKKPNILKDKYVVLYFGSILPLQGVNVVLDTIRYLKDRKDIYFDIIGPISKEYNKPVCDNVKYTEWLSQEELANHIANADICLAGHFSFDIDKASRTIPGKAYIYEMMEKPMVLGNGIANHELFKEDENHFFVELGDAKGLAKLLIEKSKDYFWYKNNSQ